MLAHIEVIYVTFNYNGSVTSIVHRKGSSYLTVDGRSVDLPYNKDGGIRIRGISKGLSIDGDGVNVKWLDESKLFITLGVKYQGLVDGECGLYCSPSGNGKPTYLRKVLF